MEDFIDFFPWILEDFVILHKNKTTTSEVMAYFKRHIDDKLLEWKDAPRRKPLLIRGARQVGKSTAVREFGKQFQYFVEINLEKQADLRQFFSENIDVKKNL